MAKTSVVDFVKQVKQEALKVTWNTRKETLITTGVVMVMIIISALFFMLIDSTIFYIIKNILAL